MKKIFLSITALTFGATVAFAQTETGIQAEQQQNELQVERMADSPALAGKSKIEMDELPTAIQESFQKSEFKDWKVAEVYELHGAGAPDTEGGLARSEPAYEILLLSEDLKEEVKESQEEITEETEIPEGKEAEVSTEKVMVEVPAVVLQYDREGKLLKQEERQEANETDLQEQY